MGIFVDYDLAEPQHSFEEVCGEDGVSNHDPDGEWYYGTDIAVNGTYQGFGIGRRLYEHRKDIARRYNRKGIIAGGVIPGFADHKHAMSAATYLEKVVAGELSDPTLTFQLRNGFECLGAIADYLPDEATDGWASFIVWHNPDYDPHLASASEA
jgi:GNAT superfamily N-acetyltransferase